MRARAAYIRSLTTTGILVALALILLAVVGTLLAFHGWPGSMGTTAVGRVPIRPKPLGGLAAAGHISALDVRRASAPRRTASVSTAGILKRAPKPLANDLAQRHQVIAQGPAEISTQAPEGLHPGRRPRPRSTHALGPDRRGGPAIDIPSTTVPSPVSSPPVPSSPDVPAITGGVPQQVLPQVPEVPGSR